MLLNRVYEIFKKSFDDGDIETPLEFKYIRKLRFLLSTVGAWPYKQFGRQHRLDYILSMYNILVIITFTTGSIGFIIYIRSHWKILSFFDLGHLFLCLIMAVFALQRFVIARTKKYKEVIKEYLLEFHLFYFKIRSSYSAKVYAQIQIISRAFTTFVLWLMFIGVSLFVLMPVYNNYSRGMFGERRPANSTFEHAIYFYMPEAIYADVKGFWIFFVIDTILSALVIVGTMVFDLLLILIVFQIWGHLKILKHNLLNIPLPDDSRMYSKEENVHIRELLKENILHHSLVVKRALLRIPSVNRFADRCSDAFNEYLFGFYFLMQLITCILLLEVTAFTADALAKYLPLTFAMYQQLILVSIMFEMINTKSEQLIDALYSIPWECMDTSNRRTVLFFLHRIQTPVSLKAAKVVPVGVNTMTKVLRTTFSYYMVLNAVARDR